MAGAKGVRASQLRQNFPQNFPQAFLGRKCWVLWARGALFFPASQSFPNGFAHARADSDPVVFILGGQHNAGAMEQGQALAISRREFEVGLNHRILGQRLIDSLQQDIETFTGSGGDPDIARTYGKPFSPRRVHKIDLVPNVKSRRIGRRPGIPARPLRRRPGTRTANRRRR